MSQDAVIRFRYELTGDGMQAVNALTGEVLKLAAAEETAIGRARALGREAAQVRPGAPGAGGPPGGGPAPSAGTAGGSPPRFGPDAPRPSSAGTTRDNPLLDDVFGRTPRQAADAAAVRRSTADPQFDRVAAPRPGGRGDDDRGRGDGPLVRALEGLTAAIGRAAGGPGAGSGGGAAGPRDDGPLVRGRTPERARGTAPAATEVAMERTAEPPAPMARAGGMGRGASVLGGAAAVGLAGEFARNQMTPFMDDNDRFWSGARKLQIPGLNVGVSDLRDLQLWLQQKGSGKDAEEEAKMRAGIDARDAMVRQPFNEFKRSWDTRRDEVGQRARDAGGYIPDWRAVPVPPPPVFRDTKLEGLSDGEKADYVSANPPAELEAKIRRRAAADRERFERETADYRTALDAQLRAKRATPEAGLLSLADLPNQARGTLPEQQRFAQETERLPARDRQVLARREVSAIEAQIRAKEELTKYHEREIVAAKAAVAKADGDFDAATDPLGRREAQARRVDAEKRGIGSERELKVLDAETRDLQDQRAQAKGGVREADAGLKRVELGQMREREDTARSQAMTLAYAGPGGRAQGEVAMQMIQQAGVSNTPAEILAMARPFFGKTLDKMAEAEGQQFQPQFQRLAPDEYRDTLPAAKAESDRLAGEIRKFEQTNPGEVLKDTLETIRGAFSFLDRLEKELEAFKRQVDAEGRQRKGE